jgi:hypothetical protein
MWCGSELEGQVEFGGQIIQSPGDEFTGPSVECVIILLGMELFKHSEFLPTFTAEKCHLISNTVGIQIPTRKWNVPIIASLVQICTYTNLLRKPR